MTNRVCHFKLVLLGDTAVGKSCLVVRFVRDEFFEFQEPTIGGENCTESHTIETLFSVLSITQSLNTIVIPMVYLEIGMEKFRFGATVANLF